MKSEKGGVLEAFLILLVLIIALVIILVVYIVRQDIEFGVKEGIVVDKKYNSAYTTMMYTGQVTIPQYHPESWEIKIQKEINGENKSIWVTVDETTYHTLNINDYYPKEEVNK